MVNCLTAKPIRIKKWQKRFFLNPIRKAIDDYGMIAGGERVLVAISGGKDSLVLAYAMAALARYSHLHFTPVFAHIDYGFGSDFSPLEATFKEWGYDLHIEATDLAEVIDFKGAKNPCYQCAKLRRGALVRVAKKLECQKIAYGHHLDDAIETFLLNLLKGGRIDSFDPVSEDPKSGLVAIRPMVYVCEENIIKSKDMLALPVLKSGCSHEEKTARRTMKNTLSEWRKTYPDIREKVLNGLQNLNQNPWSIQ